LEKRTLECFNEMQEFQRLPAEELSIGSRARRSRISDGVAVHDELDAAISLAAFGGVIRRDGLRFSKAVRGDGRRGHSLLREKIAHGISAPLGKLLIEFIGAHAVRVAFDLQIQSGVSQNDS
jgi:hypothetical protein